MKSTARCTRHLLPHLLYVNRGTVKRIMESSSYSPITERICHDNFTTAHPTQVTSKPCQEADTPYQAGQLLRSTTAPIAHSTLNQHSAQTLQNTLKP
jgi:hypothetical protein